MLARAPGERELDAAPQQAQRGGRRGGTRWWDGQDDDKLRTSLQSCKLVSWHSTTKVPQQYCTSHLTPALAERWLHHLGLWGALRCTGTQQCAHECRALAYSAGWQDQPLLPPAP